MIGRGSEWRRWEPHIHAPGTVLNNQFGGGSAWGTYLESLEAATPKIEALAVTDYYLTDTYEEVLSHKAAGRLPNVQLIFPNVELRLDVAAKTGFVNLHLLVSPEDSNHVAELHRILQRLQFQAHGDTFNCTRADLISLGKKADTSITDDRAALAHGATQFKVNFDQLRRVVRESEWAKSNILIAVAGAAGDGTSGLRQASDTTMREEIEKFAHVIFSSSPAQRDFWSGRRSLTLDQLRERFGGCKPCLHGCDAHDQKTVGRPVDDRFSWLKGGIEFDALRQACIDPEGRAHVGTEPPRTALPSQVISHVTITDGDWATTPEIPLNPGLVAIIGARGSGKTALADMIAAGCDAITPVAWRANENASPSFLVRARKLVGDASATLTWGGGATVTRFLDGRDANSHLSFPRARYLSQQFVEELCSANGVSDGLIAEIERVIFEAHSQDDRDGAIDFAELRDYRTARFQQAREREADAIADVSDRIATEFEKEASITGLTAQVTQKTGQIKSYNQDLAKLVVKGTEAQAKRHTQLGQAVQTIRGTIQAYGNQRRTFLALQDEVASTRATKAPELLRQAKERHQQSGLNLQQWDEFLLIYKGDVDKSLNGYVAWADKQIATLTGPSVPPGDPNTPLFPDTADLTTLTLNTLQAEMTRLEALVSADNLVRKQYSALSQRIANENTALQTLQARLTDAQGASARRKDLQTERDATYGRIFQAIINEQTALADLYAPLMARLTASTGTLRKLGFSVRRVVDVGAWAAVAEEDLLDRRKAGPFQGRGALTSLAESALRPAWETGSAADVQAAMTSFISLYMRDLIGHAPYAQSQQAEFRSWLKQFAHWLFDTDHVSVRYEIVYDGIDIRKLSPGTRGIVLLLLYLALDDADDRPLIIDQPEENLDPKSVFDELVALFIAAKAKRQVIMVTHNANLVINTDADQIIVADAGPHPAGGLPPIKYMAGGLENAAIRTAVCDILEGGEEAFRERARRLRVRLDR
ncbi:phosphotransferase [Xanthomonas phaseoli pv. phaseoli]|uniref:TrlF family AAA-like ATPase n=1 Tax=Xanthomonas TaxID=338 RepID=UPI0005368BA7|nr:MULTISPECIES: AAA family ATPase [Xanthomonas]KGU50878.1 phosphotransferase [Xanthomonas phaseoli pv. phaseoli]KHF48767.1 phosphotransferase [Xanthomonas phaseoli pv. phaseoli]KHS22577.1 phosphotransferase [Xanthomonas phaseoli pv. phaseoli]OOX17458.1 phosphotransferase [Xanthomonas axonopodis pv. bauhiniae]